MPICAASSAATICRDNFLLNIIPPPSTRSYIIYIYIPLITLGVDRSRRAFHDLLDAAKILLTLCLRVSIHRVLNVGCSIIVSIYNIVNKIILVLNISILYIGRRHFPPKTRYRVFLHCPFHSKKIKTNS